ncbi:MAG: GDP-mannose 4,6-dehydratase [Bacteroidales bacterium]|jgi:GDP-4-dehydro-6-deoxy-D-mannose reductase|nr:GDP-mannose 4,6-dehydratase [Bacteroidales bacterium]
MKALIVGAAGFAGKYLSDELRKAGYETVDVDMMKSAKIKCIDIRDINALKKIISDIRPDCIFNLAGFTSVAESWKNVQECFFLNVIGSINVLEAVRETGADSKIILIGSSEQYGRVRENGGSINESVALNPISPYAISKRAQEDIGKVYSAVHGMNICMTRTFNYIGIGQKSGFVISDFAEGIVKIEKGLNQVLKVGNTATFRCFTDVRDIVRAYRLIMERGIAGRIYNVGSEKSYSIKEILNIMVNLSHVNNIVIEEEVDKFRVYDTPYMQCDYSLLNQDTCWKPEIPIERTISEILQYYRSVYDR